MPDSQQPPIWGPAYHERDLDALLSGEAGSTPLALRPVGGTLAALRAAAAPRELSGEAAARAAFRAMAQPRLPWAAPAEHGTVAQDTLVLPPAAHLLPPADRRRHRAARHRRGRATWDGRRSAIALTSVGVVAVIVITVAVTGAIPGSIGQMVSFGGHPASAASSAAPTARATVSLEGSGGASQSHPSPAVTGTPSVSPSATTGPSTLCREFYDSLGQRYWAAQGALLKELAKRAGGSAEISSYCFHYLNSWDKGPGPHPNAPAGANPGGPGDSGAGSPGAGSSGAGSSGAGNSGAGNPGSGHSGGGNPGAGDPAPGAGAPAPPGA